jgi:hypothetical protein
MLPGFRFLFAAIILSMSILVFGLGATALLRAAHEQFASNPSWHAAPEANFALAADAVRPVLAMLRVEPEQKSDSGPVIGIPAPAQPILAAPRPLNVGAPAEPEQMAALKAQQAETPVPADARPETAMESTPLTEAAPAPTDAADTSATAAPEAETKVASTEPTSPQPLLAANDAMAIASGAAAAEPVSAAATAETDIAAMKIATLGGPPVAIEAAPPPAKAAADAKPDRDALRKRQQARRAAQRRRLAARARLAARQAQLQQPADPFAQPSAQPAAAARTR